MAKLLSDKTISAIIEECSKSKYRQKVVNDILTPIMNDIFLSYSIYFTCIILIIIIIIILLSSILILNIIK